ncbi:MAG: endonuclease V [Candidatus Acidiferrales bacterium]
MPGVNVGLRHRWNLTPSEAAKLQLELRSRIRMRPDSRPVRTVAGADIALRPVGGDRRAQREAIAYAGVIVYSFPSLVEIERRWAVRRVSFPYIPGLLAFREGPALLEAFRKLRCRPDLLLFDAHGYSHPRRFGLACHLSLVLDTPGIGVAKSLLVGRYDPPDETGGAWSPLVDKGETIGAALRTRAGVQPVYVSVGHRIDLETAIAAVLACCDGYRIPKPTREADHFVGQLKRGELGGRSRRARRK